MITSPAVMRISQLTNRIAPVSKRTKLKRMGGDVFGKVLESQIQQDSFSLYVSEHEHILQYF